MVDPHALPSRDPANDDSLLGMARQILDKFLQQVDDCLPARVVSYDRATNRATVIPLVKLLTTDGRQVGRAQIASVPVMQYGGNGAVLSFDLKAGDLGWIKANDRDISLIMQAYKDSAPNTLRKHSFQDAVFLPDVMHGFTIAGEDAHNAVLQTLDGAVRIALWPDRVKITAGAKTVEVGPANITATNGAEVVTISPTKINLTDGSKVIELGAANILLTNGAASLTMTAAGTTFGGPVAFSDAVTLTGGVSGAVTMPDGATIGNIAFGTHVHSDPQGGTTGGPQ